MEKNIGKEWDKPDNVEGIPMSSPIADGIAGWKKGKIDEIHLDGLAELDRVPLESMREWLQEILDAWPNIPKEWGEGIRNEQVAYSK